MGSPQVPNAPFTLSVEARDVNNLPITNYNSPVALSAAGDGGPLPVTPAMLTTWVNGAWTGDVRVGGAGTNVILTADDGQGHTSASNAFDLVVGPLDHFGWSPIASPQTRDTFSRSR